MQSQSQMLHVVACSCCLLLSTHKDSCDICSVCKIHVQVIYNVNVLQGDGKDVKDSKDESGPYWSLMFEVSESYCKPVNQNSIKLGGEEWPEIVKETIIGALNTKLVSADDQIVSIYHRYNIGSPCSDSLFTNALHRMLVKTVVR